MQLRPKSESTRGRPSGPPESHMDRHSLLVLQAWIAMWRSNSDKAPLRFQSLPKLYLRCITSCIFPGLGGTSAPPGSPFAAVLRGFSGGDRCSSGPPGPTPAQETPHKKPTATTLQKRRVSPLRAGIREIIRRLHRAGAKQFGENMGNRIENPVYGTRFLLCL